MIKLLRNINSLLLLILTISACSYEETKQTTISVEKICECYKEQKIRNIDERLGDCVSILNDFLKELQESNFNLNGIEELSKYGSNEISSQMSKSCESYRNSLIQESERLFKFEKLSQAKNILEKHETHDTIEIAKAFLTLNEIQNSITILDEYLLENPNADLAHFMKSYCYYQENRINKSILSIDYASKKTKSDSMKEFFKLYRNVVSPITPYENINLTITKNKDS